MSKQKERNKMEFLHDFLSVVFPFLTPDEDGVLFSFYHVSYQRLNTICASYLPLLILFVNIFVNDNNESQSESNLCIYSCLLLKSPRAKHEILPINEYDINCERCQHMELSVRTRSESIASFVLRYLFRSLSK